LWSLILGCGFDFKVSLHGIARVEGWVVLLSVSLLLGF